MPVPSFRRNRLQRSSKGPLLPHIASSLTPTQSLLPTSPQKSASFDSILGCAANPFADAFEFRVRRLANKVAAGAEFVQTQCIFDLKRFEQFLKMVRDEGLDEKTFILAGVTLAKTRVLRSPRSAFWTDPTHGRMDKASWREDKWQRPGRSRLEVERTRCHRSSR